MSDLFTYLYTPPSLDELVDSANDSLPDPEGYVPGQETQDYTDPWSEQDSSYDDAYEPDVSYDAY